MSKTWHDILKAECDRTSKAAVARKLGYARSSVSLAYHGRYPVAPTKIGEKVMAVFGGLLTCPHLAATITPKDCHDLATGQMPTNDAVKHRHWTACQSCTFNPNRQKEEA